MVKTDISYVKKYCERNTMKKNFEVLKDKIENIFYESESSSEKIFEMNLNLTSIMDFLA